MKVALFTASNDRFFPFLEGMISSLFSQLEKGIKRVDAFDVYVFDNNLSEQNKNKLPNVNFISLNMDISLFYPNFIKNGSDFGTLISGVVRPCLPEFVSGYDTIMWVDADIWFQDNQGIEDILWGTEHGMVSVIPETDRHGSYIVACSGESWITGLFQFFGPEAVSRFTNFPLINNGIFAAKVDSTIWKFWKQEFNVALKNSEGIFNFGIDQTSFNYAIYSHNISFVPLPFTYNYNARLDTTMIDGHLCVNSIPFEKISIVHLIGDSKWKPTKLIKRDTNGKIIEVVPTMMCYESIALAKRSSVF